MTFRCYKLGLIFLNIIYMIVGLTLIIVPVSFKISAVLTSWPIVGGTIACGVFLMLLSIAGIYGAIKHHQIILFFYMAIMIIVFIILFSVSVAALSISSSQQRALPKKGWASLSNKTKEELQKTGDCCGFDPNFENITYGPYGHPSCAQLTCCTNHTVSCPGQCDTCYDYLTNKGLKTVKNDVGGIGLFFSFTLFLGVYIAFRYRHLKDPRANPSAFL